MDAPAFLVLSEDAAADSRLVIAALAKKMLRFLVTEYIDLEKLIFEPPPHRLRGALSGNGWKSTSPRDQYRYTSLLQTIASHLARDRAFVIFHYDGDVAWAERNKCPHDSQFSTKIVDPVKEILRGKFSAEETERRISRIVVLRPFYCIEAWTYQNFAQARALTNNEADIKALSQWESTPSLLDEVIRPWEQLTLAKAHNRALADNAFPSERVFSIEKSFFFAVFNMLAADGLHEALTTP